MTSESRLTRLLQIYRNSPLLQGSIWYTFGQFALKVLTFLSIFIFTRLLTTDEYGTVALFTTWMMIFAKVTTLNLDAAVGRGYVDYEGQRFNHFTSALLTLALLASVLAIGILAIMPQPWLLRIFQLDRSLVVMAAVVGLFVMVYHVNQRVWQMRDQHRWFVGTSFFIEIGIIVLSLILIFTPHIQADTGRILSYMLIYGIIGIVILVQRFRLAPLQIKREFWLYGLAFALPTLPHVVASVMLNQFDRVMIDVYVGRSEAGIYSFAYQLGSITSMVWFAINTAWVPWFYRKMKAEEFPVVRLRTWQYQLAFTAMTIVLMFIMPFVVRSIAPSEYQGAIPIIPSIIGGGFFQMLYSFSLAAETYHKRTVYVSIGTVVAGVANVVLNMIFIPRYGYLAAGWTTLASYIMLFMTHTAFVYYGLKVRNIYHLRLMFALAVGVTLLTIIVAMM